MQPTTGYGAVYTDIRTDGNSINVLGNIHGGLHLLNSTSRTESSQCLHDLRVTDPSEDRARIERDKDRLLKDCYAWILDDHNFQRWRTHDGPRLLWIKGDPGKGKTMMTMGLIDELTPREETSSRPEKRLKTNSKGESSRAYLLAYFFCQSTRPELNNAVSVLRGLLYLLVVQRAELIQHVLKRHEIAGRQLFEGTNAIWALREILSDILYDNSLPTVYLLVDALDECTSGLGDLLHIITDDSLAKPSKVKWLVTSRNLPDIERYLQPDSVNSRISLELSASHVSKAVATFIDIKVQRLVDTNRYDYETQAEVQQQLRDKAEGTFLWVSLVCKVLESVPLYRTRAVLQTLPPGLDPLYDRMMAQISAQKDTTTVTYCKDILRLITLVYRPLQLEEVATTAGLPTNLFYNVYEVIDLISRCGSFLTVRENSVFFIHLSAKDYFTSGNGRQMLGGAVVEEQGRITYRLLNAMHSTLQRDICNLQNPGARIQEARNRIANSSLLQIAYACEYWIQHLEACTADYADILVDGGKVHSFYQEHLLHWLEAMSLLERIPEAIAVLQALQQALKGPESTTVSKYIHEALRFAMWSGPGIQETPLQVYYGALVLAPKRSIVRRQFSKEMPAWVQVRCGLNEDWGPLLQTLEGHTGEVDSVTFSPVGDRLASSSGDTTVRVWDANTWRLLYTLKGHTDKVTSVAFSPAGDRLASASHDKTVWVWDANERRLLYTLEGHTSGVNSVAFAPAGDRLASASHDKTVRVWNANKGRLLYTLEGHTEVVNSVVFSSEGDRLASASRDKTVRVWDANTGRLLYTLEGHTSWVNSVVFAPAGDRLASASRDMIVWMWDANARRLLYTLEGHTGSVTSVAFSPAGDRLASASHDRTVRVWDANTGPLLYTLEGHTSWVNSVAFAPAGDRLVSASWDTTVRVWDAKTKRPLYTLGGHIAQVYSVVFSPVGDRLASASSDKTVRVWDANKGQLLYTLEGHTEAVISIAFSPEGDRLASASYDKTARVWDANTGRLLYTLEDHTTIWNDSMSFSPAGDRLALVLHDKMVQVWDVNTERPLYTLKGHKDTVNSVAFSPAGDRLASASRDKTVWVWDASKGQPLLTFKGHTEGIISVAFSPEGDQLASTSLDKTVRVWDTNIGRLLYTLEGHTGSVTSVAFSPAGDRLVSASHDETVRVWDAKIGQPLHTLEGYGFVKILGFLQDGSCLKTDGGTIPLPPSSRTSLLSSPQHIFAKDAWLTVGSEERLWLPIDYRPRTSAVLDRRIAVGCESGHVLLLEIS